MRNYFSLSPDEIEAKTYTAWEIGADAWWQFEGYLVSTGRATYEAAGITRGENGVYFWRLEVRDEGLRVVRRYIDPDMKVKLVKIREEQAS